MRTHMDVKEGYRPLLVTVKASDHAGGRDAAPPRPGRQIAGPPEVRSVERYAPGMGYPGDEGGGPPESRLDARTRRAALSSQSRAAQPWAIPPRGPAAPGEEEPGEAAGRRRAPAAGSAGPTGDSPAHLGYGGRSGYGGETSYPGGSSGSHRRPDGPSSYPGWTAGPAAAGYAAPAPGGTGYPPATQGTGQPPATPGTGYPPGHPESTGYPPATPGTGYPAATQGTDRPAAAPGTGYPPATRGTGSGRGAGRRRREPAEGSEPGRSAAQPTSPPAMTSGGPPSRENAWRRPERRPGQEIQGAPGEWFRQRGIAASRVTVERRRLPDRGPRRTRPGARIPARTRSTRPGVPAGPVLAVERACAPRGECGRAARADSRVRPRDIRARVPAAGRERPVGRRHGHADLGGTRRRPTGG